MTEKLKKEFDGSGEVSGFHFKQIKEGKYAYIYEVSFVDEEFGKQKIYYEIFKKKTNKVCIDFKKRIYSEEDLKEVYPKSQYFGLTAFTKGSIDDAVILFDVLEKEGINNDIEDELDEILN